jgi:hypothetical protein
MVNYLIVVVDLAMLAEDLAQALHEELLAHQTKVVPLA